MNVEENRLKTFSKWPANAAVDAVRIAKAGFYYAGSGVEVQCFLCGTKISNWNYGDQAIARHRLANPTCPFVVNSASTSNVPLIAGLTNSSVEPSTISSSDNDPSQSQQSQSQLQEHRQSPLSESIVSAIQNVSRSMNSLRDYGTISLRLRSFINWPLSSIISPERLAKAGFYYLRQKDMVECVFCNGILMNWKAGDDPDSEHRLHFPNCDFYMKQESDDIFELTNIRLTPGTTTNLTELGIQEHTGPSNLKNATYEERLRTFAGWPSDHTQTPEMLSAAGFYYTGIDDQVRCFHCDGGLRNWEPKDDVWFEHARWFPTCTFLNLMRGQEFVKHCINNRPPLDPEILGEVPNENGENVTETLSPSISPQSINRSVTDRTIVQLLNTAAAQTALEIGLSVDRIKKAIKRRMEEYGISYTEAEELIEDVLHDQSMEEYLSNTSNSSLRSTTSMEVTVQPEDDLPSSSNNVENNGIYLEINKDGENEVCEGKTQEINIPNKKDQFEEKKTDNISDTMLQEENRRLKEARLCKICMDNEVAIVFLPCGHLATCVCCASPLTYCPMCRVKIRAIVRTFLS